MNVSFNDVKRGYVASNANDDPCQCTVSFQAQLCILFHPDNKIENGYTPILDCHTCHVATTIKNIDANLERRTGRTVELNPKFVRGGDACLATLEPTKPLVIETFAAYPPLGRFILRDMRRTVAVGVVEEVTRQTTGMKGGKK